MQTQPQCKAQSNWQTGKLHADIEIYISRPFVFRIFQIKHHPLTHIQATMNPINSAPAEHLQQNFWNRDRGADPWQDVGPRCRFPAEPPYIQYLPGRGWHQGDRKLRHLKPRYYWTRPHDGKRSGSWGRLKDAMTGEGPDVFVTISGDKRTLVRDRPQKWQWSRWPLTQAQIDDRRYYDPDAVEAEFMDSFEPSWTNTSSRAGARYNFKNRRYEAPQNGCSSAQYYGPNNRVWRDAQWRPGAKKSDTNPYNYQTPDLQWWNRVPYNVRDLAGARPHQ